MIFNARSAGGLALALVAVLAATPGSNVYGVSGPPCESLQPLRDGGGLRSGRPAASAEYHAPIEQDHDDQERQRRALEQAAAFAGDRNVGRLRWAAAHTIHAHYNDLGEIQDGLVSVLGATEIDPESDYGEPGAYVSGVLRVGDGKLLWSRGTYGVRPPAGGGPMLLNPRPRARRYTGAYDARTGAARWCVPLFWPASSTYTGDSAFVMELGGLTRIRLSDGARLWRAPSKSGGYTAVVAAGDTAVAGTDGSRHAIGSTAPFKESELAAFRVSDGAPLWRLLARTPEELGPNDGVSRLPAGVSGDRLIVAETRWAGDDVTVRIIARDLATGEARWSHPLRTDEAALGPGLKVMIAGSRVLVAEPGEKGKRLTAYRAGDGVAAWSVESDVVPDLSRAAAYEGRLYAAVTGERGLSVTDLRDGDIERILTLAEPEHVRAGEGTLLVQNANVTLAFDLPGHP